MSYVAKIAGASRMAIVDTKTGAVIKNIHTPGAGSRPKQWHIQGNELQVNYESGLIEIFNIKTSALIRSIR